MFRDDEGNLEKYPYTQSSVNPLWGLEDDLRDNIETRDYIRLNAHAVVKVPWVKGLSYRLNYQTNFDHFQREDFTYEGYYEIGRASCRERVCRYVLIWVVAG